MSQPNTETLPDLLLKNISRDLLLGVEEALTVGAQRGHSSAKGMDKGHIAHALGQMRHFHMNEAFHSALESAGSKPPQLKGNAVITGIAGIFTIARFNISEGVWNNGRRSQIRKQLAKANSSIEPLIQPNLFQEYVPTKNATVFFVACFSGKRDQSETPLNIQIAVPDSEMKGWLFRESLHSFLQRYELKSEDQQDIAKPKLKSGVGSTALNEIGSR